MQGQLSYAIWLSLPNDVRHKLVTLFNISRSGSTVVDYRAGGAVITSDGYTAPDLLAVSLPRMQGLLDTTDDNYYKLFEVVVLNIDALLGGTFAPPVSTQADTAPEESVTHLRGEGVFDKETGEVVTTKVEEVKRFCDQCDSKGVRHKKVCPKYQPTK